MPLNRRNHTLSEGEYASSVHQAPSYNSLSRVNKGLVAQWYDEFDYFAAQFASEINYSMTDFTRGRNKGGTVVWNVKQGRRIIITFNYPDGMEIFHISSFTRNGQYRGLHIAWDAPGWSYATNGKGYIYITHEWIFDHLGEGYRGSGSLSLLPEILNIIIGYFTYNERASQPGEAITNERVLHFLNKCKTKGGRECSASAQKKNTNMIISLLVQTNESIRGWEPYTPGMVPGGSTKVVVYSCKIQKLRALNKKLRKHKTKNKTKIEKNNKKIDKLKIKIKKEKAKAKEKLKKQKEKLKKQKTKKVHITKKIKK